MDRSGTKLSDASRTCLGLRAVQAMKPVPSMHSTKARTPRLGFTGLTGFFEYCLVSSTKAARRTCSSARRQLYEDSPSGSTPWACHRAHQSASVSQSSWPTRLTPSGVSSTTISINAQWLALILKSWKHLIRITIGNYWSFPVENTVKDFSILRVPNLSDNHCPPRFSPVRQANPKSFCSVTT